MKQKKQKKQKLVNTPKKEKPKMEQKPTISKVSEKTVENNPKAPTSSATNNDHLINRDYIKSELNRIKDKGQKLVDEKLETLKASKVVTKASLLKKSVLDKKNEIKGSIEKKKEDATSLIAGSLRNLADRIHPTR